MSRAFTDTLPKIAATEASPTDGLAARAAADAAQAAEAAAEAVADAAGVDGPRQLTSNGAGHGTG